MLSGLQSYVTQVLPDRDRPVASNLVSVSAGWESDVYTFDLAWGPADARQHETLVLRLYPGADAYVKSGREFLGMRRLHAAGYPVPFVHALERDHSPFGKPCVLMEYVEGRMLWEPLFRAPEPRQSQLLTLFCGLFVRLHRLAWEPFVDDPAISAARSPYNVVDAWLKGARMFLGRYGLEDTDRALDWLEARRDRITTIRPAPVHWDFHPGNVLLRADDAAMVIDWTSVQVSDPRFDLAWTLVLVGAQEGWAWRDRILAEYRRLWGSEIPELDWFEVAACTRRLFSVIISLSAGPESLGMRPEAAEMMRRGIGALRNVYDLFRERTGGLRLREAERILGNSG